MQPRWMIERHRMTYDGDLLQTIEIYAEGEKKEQVKRESRQYSHKRHLMLIDKERTG